jgi:hypothetical protein
MKPYRRNWMIGFFLILTGVASYLFSIRNSLYFIGAGVIVAGWSGRVWVYEERQKTTSEKR